MARGRASYYDKRQVIQMELVEPGDYEDRVILCIPKFAWDVARPWLAKQAQWKTTYAMAYYDNYYETPSDEEMDIIQASIDAALAEDDMSCNIVEAIEALTATVAEAGAYAGGCGCGGSRGAGTQEPEPLDWEDTGENWPDGFSDRPEFDQYRCDLAYLIAWELYTDLEYLKSLAITQITSTALAIAMLTPIPWDDLGVMAGILIAFATEAILDSIIDYIMERLQISWQTIICGLYNALSPEEALAFLQNWYEDELDWQGELLMKAFVSYANINRLYERTNRLPVSADCSMCEEVHWYSCHNGDVVDETEEYVTIQGKLESDGSYLVTLGVDTLSQLEAELLEGSFINPPTWEDFMSYRDSRSGSSCGCGRTDVCWEYWQNGFKGDWGMNNLKIGYRSGDQCTIKIWKSGLP